METEMVRDVESRLQHIVCRHWLVLPFVRSGVGRCRYCGIARRWRSGAAPQVVRQKQRRVPYEHFDQGSSLWCPLSRDSRCTGRCYL
jgi:hypothetical protein